MSSDGANARFVKLCRRTPLPADQRCSPRLKRPESPQSAPPRLMQPSPIATESASGTDAEQLLVLVDRDDHLIVRMPNLSAYDLMVRRSSKYGAKRSIASAVTPASSRQPRITSVTMATCMMEHLFSLHALEAGRHRWPSRAAADAERSAIFRAPTRSITTAGPPKSGRTGS